MCFLFWFAPSVHAPPRGSFSVRTMRQVDGTCSHILAAAFITGGLKINSLEARAEFSAACPNLNKVLVCHTSQIITSCNASVKGYFNIELLSCTPSFLVTIPLLSLQFCISFGTCSGTVFLKSCPTVSHCLISTKLQIFKKNDHSKP